MFSKLFIYLLFFSLQEIDKNVSCREALMAFKQKARFPLTEKPDYNELRSILTTEMTKYKNEPDYDKFDWQKPTILHPLV